MKQKIEIQLLLIISFIIITLISCKFSSDPSITERNRLFNAEWKFIRDSLLSNQEDIITAEKPRYDDSQWMVIDLPHDYSIMDLPGEDGPDQVGPFSKSSPGGGRANGLVMGGTAWYRKHFKLDKSDAGKTAVLHFDGVYMETEVWINGKSVGIHKYGYTPFWFDITPFLNPAGESNIIAVKVDNTGRNTRWYSGSGIYRNVHLIMTDPVHVAVWGVKVKTPKVNETSAVIDVAVNVQNDDIKPVDAVVKIKIFDSVNKIVGETERKKKLEAKISKEINEQITVSNPILWSLESPNIYQAEITISVNNKITDKYKQSFGIRSLDFSAEKGFLLNGKSVNLKGGCMHHDNGLLGSAAINRAEIRRIEIMKANGYNAIRCSHNPPSETFLDACDSVGILVIDEFADMWEYPKNPQDYSRFFKEWWKKDLTNMVYRDINHPSIIMWSIGNELWEKDDIAGMRVRKQLVSTFKELDNSRPVTEAINDTWEVRKQDWNLSATVFAALDISGYNYEWVKMAEDHKKYPDRIMYHSESLAGEAYDNWKIVEKHPYVIGDFIWTSLDYLGEAGIGNTQYISKEEANKPQMPLSMPSIDTSSSTNTANVVGAPTNVGIPPDFAAMMSFLLESSWPRFGAYCGDIDITGEKKPQMAYRDVIWNNSKIEMNVHAPIHENNVERVGLWGWPDEWSSWNWNGNEGKQLQVRVFTSAPKVRLVLNSKIVGEKTLSETDKYIATFEVPYQPGELKAIALENGIEVAHKVLKTSGKAVGIRLTPERSIIRADRNDLSFIKIEIVDENCQLVPQDSIVIKLTVTGNGELVASGNANPTDIGSVNKPIINTYKGKAQAILRPYAKSGKINLRAESKGLKPAELNIMVNSKF